MTKRKDVNDPKVLDAKDLSLCKYYHKDGIYPALRECGVTVDEEILALAQGPLEQRFKQVLRLKLASKQEATASGLKGNPTLQPSALLSLSDGGADGKAVGTESTMGYVDAITATTTKDVARARPPDNGPYRNTRSYAKSLELFSWIKDSHQHIANDLFSQSRKEAGIDVLASGVKALRLINSRLEGDASGFDWMEISQ